MLTYRPGKSLFFILQEIVMRALMSVVALLSVAMPAFAAPTFNVPEPETMALLAVAAVGMMIVRRIKK